ncbi:MAG TPA: hypothetical protein VKY29_03100, partial [Cryomorphaceae bacterium]|nr:hypothetical protein [Cryomorphaceae bacterium]
MINNLPLKNTSTSTVLLPVNWLILYNVEIPDHKWVSNATNCDRLCCVKDFQDAHSLPLDDDPQPFSAFSDLGHPSGIVRDFGGYIELGGHGT